MEIEFTPSACLDGPAIVKVIRELALHGEVTAITFDPYAEFGLSQGLIEAGFPPGNMIQRRHGAAALPPHGPLQEWPRPLPDPRLTKKD